MYGGSYVANLFKQKVVSHKHNMFATVTLHNNLFCHRFSDYRHCKNPPFTDVLKKDISTLSRRSKRTPFRKNVPNEISRKSNLNHITWVKFCDGSFAMVQGFFKENVRYPAWTCRDPISLILGTPFYLNLGPRFSILGTRIGSLKHLKKVAIVTPVVPKFFYMAAQSQGWKHFAAPLL